MELFKLLKYSTTVICFCTFVLYLNERFWLIGSGNSIKSSPREFLLVIKWNALHTEGILFFLVAACLSQPTQWQWAGVLRRGGKTINEAQCSLTALWEEGGALRKRSQRRAAWAKAQCSHTRPAPRRGPHTLNFFGRLLAVRSYL